MNVDGRGRASSAVRFRILIAGLLLLGAGCSVLGWRLPSRQHVSSASTPTVSAPTPEASAAVQKQGRSLMAGMPLIFEPNLGQANLDPADSRARFINRGPGYSLFLGSQGAILSMVSPNTAGSDRAGSTRKTKASQSQSRVQSIEMRLAGANPDLRLNATDRLPGKSNYFIGDDPAKWRTGVPQFARVRYENVYPGINLVFYGNQGHLEYDFQVQPGSDPAQAELEFNGARRVEVKNGALVIEGEDGKLALEPPTIYQEVSGKRQPVLGKFVLRAANRVGFAVGSYDRSRELIIDPILNFSTYFGGSGDEHATSVAVDTSLNIYIAGSTTSPNLPVTAGVTQATLNGAQNVYVAKITPPLGSIVAALDDVTYLGGEGTDAPVGIKVNGEGDVFLAGNTSSAHFPTTPTNAYQTAPKAGSPGPHVFVTLLKFDFTQLRYSSYLSGNGTDTASGMTIDASGSFYVTGTTTSNDAASTTDQFPATTFPEASPYQATPRAPIQFFVTKVDTNAPGTGSIAYSTYFGGANFDTASPIAVGGGIAVDSIQPLNIYFTGTTNFLYTGCSGCSSTDFPILNAYQPCLDQAAPTVIVNPPTCSGTTATTASDAFVAKLSPTAAQGQQLIWSTYVGGTGDDSSTGVALDPGAANVYVVGTTNSTDIASNVNTLTTSAAYQRCLDTPVNPASGTACPTLTAPNPNDAFVARLTNPTSTGTTTTNVALSYFSYLGGTANEAGLAITVDSNSGALLTGWTQSADFPVFPAANPIQSTLNGPQDAFVARLNTAAVVGQTTTASWANYFGGSGTDSGTGITLDVNQNTYLAGETNSTDLQVAKPLTQGASNSGGYDAFVTQLGTAVSLAIQGVLTLGTNQSLISAGNQATFTYTVTNNGPDLASNIVITDNLSSVVTGVPVTFVSASINSGTCSGGTSTNTSVSCGPISLQSGSTATLTVVVTPTPQSSTSTNSSNGCTNSSSPLFFNGGTVQAMAQGNIVLAQTSVPAEMSDYNMCVGPPNQSIAAAGDTAVYQVKLTPNPLYGSSISLSCSGLPSAAACNFTNSPLTLVNASGATSTLNVTTTARPITTTTASSFTRGFYAIWLFVPGLALLGGSRRRRRILGSSAFLLISALLLFVPACSHSTTQVPPSGTPAGTYTITVTAASGTDSKSLPVVLTVP